MHVVVGRFTNVTKVLWSKIRYCHALIIYNYYYSSFKFAVQYSFDYASGWFLIFVILRVQFTALHIDYCLLT